MNLKHSGIRFFQELYDDLAKIHPHIFSIDSLLQLKIFTFSTKHAAESDFDKQIRSLLNDVNLVFVSEGPFISDGFYGNLFNSLNHVLELIFIKGGTEGLTLLLPHHIGLSK